MNKNLKHHHIKIIVNWSEKIGVLINIYRSAFSWPPFRGGSDRQFCWCDRCLALCEETPRCSSPRWSWHTLCGYSSRNLQRSNNNIINSMPQSYPTEQCNKQVRSVKWFDMNQWMFTCALISLRAGTPQDITAVVALGDAKVLVGNEVMSFGGQLLQSYKKKTNEN